MIKNVFYCWPWTSNIEQVLEEKTNFNKKKSREVQSMQVSSTSWVMDFPSAKFTMTQMMVCLTFPSLEKLNIATIIWVEWLFCYYSAVESCIEHRTQGVLWTFVLQTFFWSMYDCNHANCRKIRCHRIKCSWLCALDHELQTSFHYLRRTTPVYKQNYKK